MSASVTKPSGSAGFTARLYVGARTPENMAGEAKDIRLSLRRQEVDATSIDDAGWRTCLPGPAEAALEFTLLRKTPESPAARALRSAFLSGAAVEEVSFVNDKGHGWQCDLVVLEAGEDWDFGRAIANTMRARINGAPTLIGG